MQVSTNILSSRHDRYGFEWVVRMSYCLPAHGMKQPIALAMSTGTFRYTDDFEDEEDDADADDSANSSKPPTPQQRSSRKASPTLKGRAAAKPEPLPSTKLMRPSLEYGWFASCAVELGLTPTLTLTLAT